MDNMPSQEITNQLLEMQKSEITEHLIYKKLAQSNTKNKKLLERIASDELRHYNTWKKYTKKEVKPNNFVFWKYYLISKLFGITFGLKLMEKGEENAQKLYNSISQFAPEAKIIEKEENEHEKQLLRLIDEEKLTYVSSMVLGLNDALVELTGTLAGLTFALQNSNLVAIAGGITGIAASLSMAASEYQSTKAEDTSKNPIKAAAYTGLAYTLTVFLLVLPFFLLSELYVALAVSLLNVIIILLIFTYYLSVAKEMNFKKRFFEMASISLGVAFISFIIGYLIRIYLGVDI